MVVVAGRTRGLFNVSFSPLTTVLITGAQLLLVREEYPKVRGVTKRLHPVPWASREGESSNLANLVNL